jgi:5-methylcytosine-specific restriction endonuclease McrA
MIHPYGHNQVTKQCLACGKSYVSYESAKRKYCCEECRYAARREERGNCSVCGKPIKAGRTKFCSLACRSVAWTGQERPSARRSYKKVCEHCGEEFIVGGREGKHTYQRYCSNKCSAASQRITIDLFWKKGGKTSSKEWEIFRDALISAADGKCELCGNGHGLLQVHHILPRRFGGNHEPSNLLVLCNGCHSGLDKVITMIKTAHGIDGIEEKIRLLMKLVSKYILDD